MTSRRPKPTRRSASTPPIGPTRSPRPVFADGPDSSAPRAFTARFDLGYKEVSLQAKVKKGVLVVANFNRFSDNSGRAAFFSREFFYRAPALESR